MKSIGRFAAFILTILFSATALYAQRPQAGPSSGPARSTAAPVAAVNDQLLQALYVSEFQRQVGINDEQLVNRLRTILGQWFQQRRNATARRNEAMTSLRRLLSGAATDEEIAQKIGEADTADNQVRNAERRLQILVDPLLTPQQQARFRLFQVDIEQRIRDLLAEAARPAANPQNQPRGGRGPR